MQLESVWNKPLVPGAGIEPARLAAGDFLTTSVFTADVPKNGVRGLEHAFTIASRQRFALGARRLLSTPSEGPFGSRAWLGISSDLSSRAFTEFDGLHLWGFPRRAQIWSESPASTNFTTRAKL